jgi:hypothetical protein
MRKAGTDADDDDPRRERQVMVTVLAYPGMPDEEITAEIGDLVSDPRVAFTVTHVEMSDEPA